MSDQRPGDNLYSASTIAIDVATGKIRGYHQYTPNESWDWDEVSPPLLIDYQRKREDNQGSDRCRPRRLHLVPRAHRRRRCDCFPLAPDSDPIGEVQGWNFDTGKLVWKHNYSTSHNWAGLQPRELDYFFTSLPAM